MQKKLIKYQIGLAVIGLFTLGLVIFMVIQASVTRYNTQVHKDAQQTADRLNEYITEKEVIPKSLDAAGISYDSETVSYKKLSSNKYRFCVTYSADGSSIDGTSLVVDTLYGGGASYRDYYDNDSYEHESLYLDSDYKKGENCQTVSPYIVEDYNYDDFYSSDDSYNTERLNKYDTELKKCTESSARNNQKYNKCLDELESNFETQ